MFDFIPDYVFLLVFGFLLLIKGGDWFVDAATSIAKRLIDIEAKLETELRKYL